MPSASSLSLKARMKTHQNTNSRRQLHKPERLALKPPSHRGHRIDAWKITFRIFYATSHPVILPSRNTEAQNRFKTLSPEPRKPHVNNLTLSLPTDALRETYKAWQLAATVYACPSEAYIVAGYGIGLSVVGILRGLCVDT